MNKNNKLITMDNLPQLSDFKTEYLNYLIINAPKSDINPEITVRDMIFSINEAQITKDCIQNLFQKIWLLHTNISQPAIQFINDSPNSVSYMFGKYEIKLNWNILPHLKNDFDYYFHQAWKYSASTDAVNYQIKRKIATFTQENISSDPDLMNVIMGTDRYTNIFPLVKQIKYDYWNFEGNINDLRLMVEEYVSYINSVSIYKSNKFILSSPLDQINKFYLDYLSHLSMSQFIAALSILGMISLLIYVKKMVVIYYGENLIKKFNLEEKYPKIARYIKLRSKLQQFNLFRCLILIILIALTVIIINSYLLINVPL